MAYTPDQVAQAFINEGMRRGVDPIGIQEAICAGLDESNLRVLANNSVPESLSYKNDGLGSDHGSTGDLQQQVSQGWGTVACTMDPTCSVGMFYDHLVKEDYTNLTAHTPGWYIQQVQRSFDSTGNNYQAQWPHAVAIYNRLHGTTEGPGIPQENVDLAISIFKARIGNDYVFGGAFSPTNIRQGTDCSGMCDTILQALTHGPQMQWGRHVSTESWPYNYGNNLAVPAGTVGPYGTICAGDAQPGQPPTQYPPQIPSDATAIIYLMHGGGGEDSHMMINVNDGHGNWVLMETGGAHDDTGGIGQYASPHGPATPTNSSEWTDIWYLPGPVVNGERGFLMSLSDQQQTDLYTWVGDLHGGLFNPVESKSPFRALGEGAIWQQHELPINDDGMLHPQYVEWAARRGDSVSLQVLNTLATADPTQRYNGEDRSQDIKLAQNVLKAISTGAAPVVQPNVIQSPVRLVTPESVAKPAITAAQVTQWVRDAVTVLGVIATWATALHTLLGQYLDGSAGTTVPTLLGGATVAAGFSTVRHKNALARRLNAVAPHVNQKDSK